MTSNPSPILINRRTLVFLFGMALTQFSIAMPMVQIPVYIRELGASISQIGLFFTISMVFPLVVKVLGGWLSDSLGRLRVIFIGSLTGVLTFAAYAVAPSWQAALLGPALMALTSALTLPAYFAFIADITPEGSRGRMYGISQTVYHAAAVIAPPIGGLLAQMYGYRFLFGVSSAVFGLAAVIFIYLLRFSQFMTIRPQEISLRSLGSSLSQMAGAFMAGGVVAWILIIDGFRDVVFKLSADLEPVYLTEIAGISKQGIGLLDGIWGAALLLTLFPAGWLVDRTSERLGIVLALLAAISSRLVFALASGFWGFALCWSLSGVGVGLFEASGPKLITRVIPKHLRGTAFGLLASTLSLFSLPAPWIGSQIWNLAGPRWPFLVTAALGGLTLLPAWFKLALPAEPRAARRAAEAATLPTIGHSEVATVLFARFPPNTESSVHDQAKQILLEHGAVLDPSMDTVLVAWFGISPRRSPPQVSALLATHAGLSLLDAVVGVNPDRAAAGLALPRIDIGIATGDLTTSPAPPEYQHDQGVRSGEEVTVMGDLLRAAERLQSYGPHSGGVLISERTYLALGPALHQFVFGRSGPVRLPGEVRESRAYEVLGRAQPLGPTGQPPLAE